MTGITETDAAILAARHVSAFNDAVAAGNFSEFLRLLADDAVVRFENVPGAGVLEFAGREAYAKAYAEQPPDDQISICGRAEPDQRGEGIVVPFEWRRDGARGTMRLSYTDAGAQDLDSRLITRMTVAFA